MSSKSAMYNGALMQNAAAATANGTTLPVDGFSVATFQVVGTFSATVTWEANIDQTNWVAVQATNLADGTAATTATAAGLFRIQCFGLSQIRARVSTYASGNVTVTGRAIV